MERKEETFVLSLSLLALLSALLAFFFGAGLMYSPYGDFLAADYSYRAILIAFGGEGSPAGENGSLLIKFAFVGLIVAFLSYCLSLSSLLSGGKWGKYLPYVGSGVSLIGGILFLCGGTVAPIEGYYTYLSDGFLLPAILALFVAIAFPGYALFVRYSLRKKEKTQNG